MIVRVVPAHGHRWRDDLAGVQRPPIVDGDDGRTFLLSYSTTYGQSVCIWPGTTLKTTEYVNEDAPDFAALKALFGICMTAS